MPAFKRIVKMTFRTECVPDFLAVFEASSPLIRQFPGCLHLELWRSRDTPHVLFTFSIWDNPDALEAYRHSDLFRTTWARTKPLFAEPASAWSVDELYGE
jgi:quinol monooxygenase YgiN